MDTLVNTIHSQVTVGVAQSSLPFTAVTMTLAACQMTVNTLGQGQLVDGGEIYRARKAGFGRLADIASRLNHLMRHKLVNQEPAAPPLLLDATNVSRTIGRHGDKVQDLKREFFKKGGHMSMILDESTTTGMGTRPVYVGFMSCSLLFEWLLTFAGQTDTSGCETAQVYFDKVKGLCIHAYGIDVWKKIIAYGTDGCHSMRSSREYEGVDARGAEGESFAAKVTADVGSHTKPLFFHSLLHILMLALGDGLASALPKHWISSVRQLRNYFSRSAKRKNTARAAFAEVMNELNALAAQFANLYETHGWQMTFPKSYCATRWLGLASSTSAAVQSWGYLSRMKTTLIDEGYGPPLGDDLGDGDGDEEDEELAALLALDGTGTGNDDAAKSKRDVLLDPVKGITDLNYGLNSLVCSALKPYTLASTQLQTTLQPIQHRVARVLRKLRRSMLLITNDVFGDKYAAWRDLMLTDVVDKHDLVDAVDAIGKSFASDVVKRMDARIKVYMPYYCAMELIDPTAPDMPVKDSTWAAVKDLCDRYTLNFKELKTEIIEMRGDAEELSRKDTIACRQNLLRYYHDRVQDIPEGSGGAKRYLKVEAYARIVFILPFETVLVESLFSIMNYNKDKTRSTLADSKVEAIIHTKAAVPALGDPTAVFAPELILDTNKSLDHSLSW